jgi:predicted DNA-binding transcriptional regulator AlpA
MSCDGLRNTPHDQRPRQRFAIGTVNLNLDFRHPYGLILTDTRTRYIRLDEMKRKQKNFSTAHVAKLLGVSKRTLFRYLDDGVVKEPEMIAVGDYKARVWTEGDVQQARASLKDRRANIDTIGKLTELYRAAKGDKQLGDEAVMSSTALKLRHALTTPRLGPRPTNLAKDDEILTPQQLAKKLQVPVSWVYEQTRTRAGVRNSTPLPHIKMGKYLRFSWPDVVAWLDRLSKSD